MDLVLWVEAPCCKVEYVNQKWELNQEFGVRDRRSDRSFDLWRGTDPCGEISPPLQKFQICASRDLRYCVSAAAGTSSSFLLLCYTDCRLGREEAWDKRAAV